MNNIINKNDMKKVDLKIISRETIKPASPTPPHLRNFNLSLIDQINYDHYMSSILFIPNNNNKGSVTDFLSKRSKLLKESLSLILSQLYPLAGEVKDKFYIECNDKGVIYTEARIGETLEEFLQYPDNEKVKELMPDLSIAESAIGNYILGVQVNIFSCGGIGLSTSVTHKIIDFRTFMILMKAWAVAARGSPETISLNYLASDVFPTDHCLEYTFPNNLITSNLLHTKRFVFDSASLAHLKAQIVDKMSPSSRGPSRMEVTTSIIWKVAAKAASTVRPFGKQSPHILTSLVDIRNRASPAFPENSIGNIYIPTVTMCFPESKPDFPTLLGKLRESIVNVNSDYIEYVKGENGHEMVKEMLKEAKHLTSVINEGDWLTASSLLNSGIYDLDFGWGKPIWFYVVNPGEIGYIVLNDTLKGSGVEATISLSPEEMEIFESDPELLYYASVNPSPLQYLN